MVRGAVPKRRAFAELRGNRERREIVNAAKTAQALHAIPERLEIEERADLGLNIPQACRDFLRADSSWSVTYKPGSVQRIVACVVVVTAAVSFTDSETVAVPKPERTSVLLQRKAGPVGPSLSNLLFVTGRMLPPGEPIGHDDARPRRDRPARLTQE